MRHRGVIAAGALAAAAVGSAVLAGRSRGRAWRAEPDPAGDDLLALPAGRSWRLTTSDGAELAVTDSGAGPLVVLAHCYTGTRGVWAPVARRLVATGHRVVLWDQRGHGASTVGSEGMTIERIGDDLRELLDHLEATDAVVVGHSMGGMTVMSLVGRHRDVVARRARAVVLVATAASDLFPFGAVVGLSAAMAGSRVATAVGRSALGPYAARGIEGSRPVWAHLDTMARLYAETAPGDARRVRAEHGGDGPAAGVDRVPGAGRRRGRHRGPPHRRGLGADIAAHLPDAELVVLPGAGHMLPLEEPDRLAHLIAACTVAGGGGPCRLTAARSAEPPGGPARSRGRWRSSPARRRASAARSRSPSPATARAVAGVDLDGEGVARLAKEIGGVRDSPPTSPSAAVADRVVDDAVAALGRVDILVNAAGTSSGACLLDTTVDVWDRIQAVNLRAPFLLMRAAARHMLAQGDGRPDRQRQLGIGVPRPARHARVRQLQGRPALAHPHGRRASSAPPASTSTRSRPGITATPMAVRALGDVDSSTAS